MEILTLFSSSLNFIITREIFGNLPSLTRIKTPDDFLESDIMFQSGTKSRESIFADTSSLAHQIEFLEGFIIAKSGAKNANRLAVHAVVAEIQHTNLLVDLEHLSKGASRGTGQVAFRDGHVGHVGVTGQRLCKGHAQLVGLHLEQRVVLQMD